MRPDQVPPDTEWNAENPPFVFGCTGHDGGHLEACDGSCERIPLTELDVKLGNEMKAWARAGMVPIGAVAGFMINGQKMPGIDVDILHLETQLQALVSLLVETDPEWGERLNVRFQETLLRKLWNIRMANEDNVREARVARMLGVKPAQIKRLIGPNGEQLST